MASLPYPSPDATPFQAIPSPFPPGEREDVEDTIADLFGDTVRARAAMGSHQSASGGADEWLTPPDLISALGSFDLDPCAPIDAPWATARKHYTIADDGFRQDWSGRVWLNPPYSQAGKWLARLAEHKHGTALIFARTETRLWFEHVWPKASGILFLKGRLHFHYANGKRAAANSGAPSALIAYGRADAEVLAAEPWPGHFVRPNKTIYLTPVQYAEEIAAAERRGAQRGGVA